MQIQNLVAAREVCGNATRTGGLTICASSSSGTGDVDRWGVSTDSCTSKLSSSLAGASMTGQEEEGRGGGGKYGTGRFSPEFGTSP